MDKDALGRLTSWLMEQALLKDLGSRAAFLVNHATTRRQEGVGEDQWRRELEAFAAFHAWLCEDLTADIARLRAANLWPWPQAPDKPGAGPVQASCNAPAPDEDEDLLRKLLEGIGGPDNM